MEVASSAEPDVRNILAWLALAHGRNRPEDADALSRHLLSLRAAGISPAQRIKLLDLLYPFAEEMVRAELPSLNLLALPISRKTRQRTRTLLQIMETLAQDYLNTLAACYDPQRPQADDTTLTALRRAMQATAMQLRLHRQIASPPRQGLWQQLHSTYRTACRLGVQNLPGSNDNPDICRLYREMMVAAVGQPAAFSSIELALVDHLTERLGDSISLEESPPAHLDDAFWIDLERDAPPNAMVRRLPGEGVSPLYFSAGELARRVGEARQALLAGAAPAELGLPEQIAGPAGLGLLQRLEKQWGSPAKRRFPRRRHSYRARLCAGLEGLQRLLKKTDTPDDISEWMVTNESPEGFALMHMTGSTAHLRVGDIVAIQPRDEFAPREDNWNICIVRWAVSENPEHVEIGLQLLSPRAISAQITVDGQHVAALILPEAPPLRPNQSLIAPAGALGENRRRLVLLIEQKNLLIREVRTGELGEQTGAIEVYTVFPDHAD